MENSKVVKLRLNALYGKFGVPQPLPAEATRKALSEIRAEELRIAYVARRTERSANVPPTIHDVTPRPELSLRFFGYAVLWIVVIVALAFLAGS